MRSLPTIKSNTPKFITYAALGIGFWIGAISLAYNYQRQATGIVASTLFSVQQNDTAKRLLGGEIAYASKWPWIHGHINQLQGKVDIRYKVKGAERAGMVEFASRRPTPKSEYEIIKFDLVTDDGKKTSLADTTV